MKINEKKPLISIGMPIYNEEVFIKESLESLLGQKYKNLEIIVSDNASTDRTWDIVIDYARRDSRLLAVRHEENKGAIYNYAYALKKAKGKYFMWAGGHDKWAPDMIERCVTHLSRNEDLILVTPQTIWIDMEGKILKKDLEEIDTRAGKSPAGRVLLMYRKMCRGNALYGVYDTEVLRKELLFVPDVIGSDLILLMRIAAHGNVISCPNAFWYRRKNRIEGRNRDTYVRQIRELKITGAAARYPLLMNRLYTIRMLCGIKGIFKDRIKLICYSFWKLILNSSQMSLLVEDIYLGSAQMLHRKRLK